MLLTLYYMAATWIQTWRIQTICNDLSRFVAQHSSIAFFAAIGAPRNAAIVANDASSSTSPVTAAIDSKAASDVVATNVIADEDTAGMLVKNARIVCVLERKVMLHVLCLYVLCARPTY